MDSLEAQSFSEVDPLVPKASQGENEPANHVSLPTTLKRLQFLTLITAHILTLFALILAGVWTSRLGGLSWEKEETKPVLNWHPLMMITAFLFMTISSLSFRHRLNRRLAKLLHVSAWTIAAICGTVGLVAVFRSHNNAKPPKANLYSLHSWIGVLMCTLFFIQFVSGFITFAVSGLVPEAFKNNVLIVHNFIGPVVYIGVLVTILTGIQEKERCKYDVSSPDTMPFQNYNKIPEVCRMSHQISLLLLFAGVSTIFTLKDFRIATDKPT